MLCEQAKENEKEDECPLAINYVKNGVPYPPMLDQMCVENFIKNWKLLPEDVYVVGFLRSGTTWTQQILKLIRNNGVDDGVELYTSVPWAESNPDEWKDMASPRSFKIHSPYELAPGGEPAKSPAKYIYIARNPKDVAVSNFHLMELYYKVTNFTGTWDTFFELFLTGKVYYGSWFDHVLGWWKNRDADNILFIKYEDRKKDPKKAIRLIASFLGYNLEPQVVDSIVEQTNFASMKAKPVEKYAPLGLEMQEGKPPFIRKGIVGDWKKYFTEDQSKRFDEEYAKRMRETGLDFDLF
jgi:hypothetical protein